MNKKLGIELAIAKTLLLIKIPQLNRDLCYIVADYAFYSLAKLVQEEREHKDKYINIIDSIYFSQSRYSLHYFDTKEHWIFSSYDGFIQLQAINCSQCGEYIATSRADHSDKITCKCREDPNYRHKFILNID